jgi:hypothetical protein
MRHRPLHTALRAYAEEASAALAADVAAGAEVPFELATEGRRSRTPLYCYRPLTGAFIRERLGVLARLGSYPMAARTVAALDGVEAYLRAQGWGSGPTQRVPRDPRDRADAALRVFLDRVFDGSTDFVLADERFELAYGELEALVVAHGRSVATLVVGLPGLRLASAEVPLAEHLQLTQPDAMADVPDEARWLAAVDDEPNTLAVLTLGDAIEADAAPARLRRIVRALRLYDAGSVGLAPAGWVQLDGGPWQLVDLGGGSPARPGAPLTVAADQEDELRAFVALTGRRMPRRGELAWALQRFDLACERPDPSDALTDLLLALRALLEPEGADSLLVGRRLAALCAVEDEREALADRVMRAADVERAVVAGLSLDAREVEALTDELTEHLRALLGDALCGHLDADLRVAADALLSPV